MPLPLALVGAAALGSAGSVVVGAGINRLTGKKNTRKTVLFDAVLGATPLAAIKGVGAAGRVGVKYRKFIPAGTKVHQKFGPYTHTFSGGMTSIATKKEYYIGLGVTMAALSRPAWMGFMKKTYIKAVVNRAFPEGKKEESPSRSLTSRRKGGKTTRTSISKSKVSRVTLTRVSGTKSKSRSGKTYCKRHKQYDFCKKYNIS